MSTQATRARVGVRQSSVPHRALHKKSILWLICRRFHALNISSLRSYLSFCAKPPHGEGQVPLRVGETRSLIAVPIGSARCPRAREGDA
jgi:hypothetical protein